MPKRRYENETEQEREERDSRERERLRAHRASESEEQRSQRLSQNRERERARRANASDEQRSQTLSQQRKRERARRANENEEQRSHRLSQQRERDLDRSFARSQQLIAEHSPNEVALQGIEFDPDQDEWSPFVANRQQCIALGIPLSRPHMPTIIPSSAIDEIPPNGSPVNEPDEQPIPQRGLQSGRNGNVRTRAQLLRVALQTQEDIVESDVDEITLGEMTSICVSCKSKNFAGEKPPDGKFTACCHKGIVKLNPLPTSDLIKKLLTGEHPHSTNFMENIRQYNSALAFASMGAQVKPPPGYGPYCFRIHGQIYHRASHLHPQIGMQRKYAQLYILDSDAAFLQRMSILENVGCLPDLMKALGDHMSQINPLAHAYKMLREVELEEEAKALAEGRTMNKVFMGIHNDRNQDQRRYNVARAND